MQVDRALQAVKHLEAGPSLRSLAMGNEPTTFRDLQTHLVAAKDALLDLQAAVKGKHAGELSALLKRFHQAFDLIEQIAKKSNGK